jgi:ABC-type branched-subunit amino acid transport system permease subunit
MLFALLGLGAGALIAGLGLSIVLTFRGSGVINLAAGAFAMLAGYAYWLLTTPTKPFHLDSATAFVVTLALCALLGALVELAVLHPLRGASPLAKLAASLGLLLTAQAAVVLAFGTSSKSQPSLLPSSSVTIFERVIPLDRFLLAAIVITAAAAFAAAYRWSRFGVATRAAAENEVSAMLMGLSPRRLSLINTMLGTVVAGAVGVLVAPLVQLDATTLPLQIVPALAAAVLGRFTSFGIVCFVGLTIGMGQSLLVYAAAQSWFPKEGGAPVTGLQELLVFAAIVIAMFWRGAQLPSRGEVVEKRLPDAPRPQRLRSRAVTAVLAGMVALIVLPYDFRQALINSGIGSLLALSMVVLIGYVGQISIVQLALAGISGFVIAHLASDLGIAFPLAPLIAAVATTVLGVLTALSALRVRGVSLAVVTLAAAVAITQFVFGNSAWGGEGGTLPVPEAKIAGIDLGPHAGFRGIDGNLPSPIFGFVVLVSVVGLCLLVGSVRRSTIGQRMLAVRSNERAAAAAGVSVRNVKLTAFALSAFIASIAGALYAYNFNSVDSSQFGAFTALSVIAYAYFGGITMISGALIAGLGTTAGILPYMLERVFGLSGYWALLLAGVALVATLIVNPEGVAGTAWKKREDKRRRSAPRDLGVAASPDQSAADALMSDSR